MADSRIERGTEWCRPFQNAEHASDGLSWGSSPAEPLAWPPLSVSGGPVPSSKAQIAGALRASAIANSQRRRPSSWISVR